METAAISTVDLATRPHHLDLGRIAIFRPLGLEGLLTATPALRALRTALPEAEVTYVGDEDSVLSFLQQAQDRRFEMAIQLHGCGLISNPLSALLGARHTAGFYSARSVLPRPGEVSDLSVAPARGAPAAAAVGGAGHTRPGNGPGVPASARRPGTTWPAQETLRPPDAGVRLSAAGDHLGRGGVAGGKLRRTGRRTRGSRGTGRADRATRRARTDSPSRFGHADRLHRPGRAWPRPR